MSDLGGGDVGVMRGAPVSDGRREQGLRAPAGGDSGLGRQHHLKDPDRQEQGRGNAALAVTGMLLFWPALFFTDLSEADKVELEALRQRRNSLARLCKD